MPQANSQTVAQTILEGWLLGRLTADVGAWWKRGLESVRAAGVASDAFVAPWSGAGRRLGRVPLAVGSEEAAELRKAGADWVPAGWGTDEAGRALLLLAAAERRPAAETASAVTDLFNLGEMREQQAVLKTLPHLAEPPRYVDVAADAVRNNVLSVIEALACDNPYPSLHMPEPAFNQLIMKSLFNGLPLGRVVGLSQRNNPELRRMVAAYASERRAAGRVVPEDVALVLG